jgi:hypothetical protein
MQLGQEAFHNLKLQLDCDYWRNQLDDVRSSEQTKNYSFIQVDECTFVT